MSINAIPIFLLILFIIMVVIYGSLTKKRSILIAIVAGIVSFCAFTLSNIAWAETKSMQWTIGYATFGLFSLFITIRQLIRKRTTKE